MNDPKRRGAPLLMRALNHTIPDPMPWGLSEAEYRSMWAVNRWGCGIAAAEHLGVHRNTVHNHACSARAKMADELGPLPGVRLHIAFDRYLCENELQHLWPEKVAA